MNGPSLALLSAWLLPLSAATFAQAQPVAPRGVVATGEPSRIRLDWDDNSEPDLTAYHIYRSVTPGGPYTRLDGSMTLVPASGVWRFHDQGKDLGRAWREPGFDDKEWAFGPGPFSNEKENAATVLSMQPGATNTYVTYYFRGQLTVGDPSAFTQWEVLLQSDDGAVLYFNGQEVLRHNMPDGLVSHTTLALEAAEGPGEPRFRSFLLPADALVAGTNSIAVEIHQAKAFDADVRFAFQLSAHTASSAHLPARIRATTNTASKPQSKTWRHRDTWWAVFPDESGTWLWRLDQTVWAKERRLTTNTSVRADCKAAGDQAHILLFNRTASQLVSVECIAADSPHYRPWPERPDPADVPLSSGAETATIDIDSTGRMWLASDTSSRIEVRYSDPPYATWHGPITLASGIRSDDICLVTSLPDGTVGVLWSNQADRRFGFRTHRDGDDAALWSGDEVPASQSALEIGLGMADDHLNVAVASDNTLYAAVKTSYDTNGYPKIALLVRRPSGKWDPLHEVDRSGTRPIVVLHEDLHRLMVIYTSREVAGDIVFKESPAGSIQFGPRQRLLTGGLNDPSSTKQNAVGELVVLASDDQEIASIRLLNALGSNPLRSEYLDHTLPHGQSGYYRVTAVTSQESPLSSEATATPLPAPPNAQARSASSGTGNLSGNLADTFVEDGLNQVVGEVTTGSRGRAGFLVDYTLTTPAPRANILGFIFQFAGSWSGTDPGESPVAMVWNVASGDWLPVHWPVGIRPAHFQTNLSASAQDYVDNSGRIRIRFTDGADLEREKKDALALDLLGGYVLAGPRPPPTLQAAPGDTLLDLSWDPSPDANVLAYDIERNGVRIAFVVAGTTATDVGLSNGFPYTYTVKAVDPAGRRSLPSPPASTTPDAALPPRTPSGWTATVTNTATHRQVLLHWVGNLERNVTGYRIYRSTSLPVGTGLETLLTQVPHSGAGRPHVYNDADTVVSDTTTFYYVLLAVDAEQDASAPTPPVETTLTVLEVNQAPSFTKGPDLTVQSDAGPQSFLGWASDISPGPNPYETNQQVRFEVSHDGDQLFAQPPLLDPNGTLTFTPAGHLQGTATVSVVALDDGETAWGGQDSSPPQTFTITVLFPPCPNPVGQSVWMVQNSTKTITLTAQGDTSGSDFAIVSPPAHGSWSGLPPQVIYTPDLDYLGPDRFSFQIVGTQCAGGTVAEVLITISERPALSIESLNSNPLSHRIGWQPDIPGFQLQLADGLNRQWSPAPSGMTNPVVIPAPTSFLYRGWLTDQAGPVNGRFDFQFGLYADAENGTPQTDILSRNNVSVVNDQFTTTLDFGVLVLPAGYEQPPQTNPPSYWLEIAARPAGSGLDYTTLKPRSPAVGSALRFYRLVSP